MNTLGELSLLGALVASGYAAFACIAGYSYGHRAVSRSGDFSALAGLLALTAATGVLAWALLAKDFRFAYVAQYSNRLLPGHYALSALWVGQAGSLLLWAWFSGALAVAYRFWPRRQSSPLRQPAFGVLMACLCLLVAMMVFGADPMQRSLGTPGDGAGLSPLLQHPAMLIHPPFVLLGYAAWAVPFALAVAGLAGGPTIPRMVPDADWVREARPWALFSWAVLGGGILWGAEWAYEELGWGGYWAWDPIENASLIPWLTGTALIHTMMAWRYCGVLKKTALSLAIATFGLCDFAAFLTRSGIASSLHAFNESPLGWMFLGLMAAVILGGGLLMLFRRKELIPQRPIPSVWSREAWVLISAVALLLLAAVTLAGTLIPLLSKLILGRGIVVGTAFYNNVLTPTGLLLLAATAAAPLLRWGGPPRPAEKRALFLSAGVGGLGAALAWAVGLRQPILLAVVGLAASAAASATVGLRIWDLGSRIWDFGFGTRGEGRGTRGEGRGKSECRMHNAESPNLKSEILNPKSRAPSPRKYAGHLIHLGIVCLAVGVAGSSLGSRRQEVVMGEGQTIQWAGRSIRCTGLIERELPDRLVTEAQLEVSHAVGGYDIGTYPPPPGAAAATLLPARHLHRLQNEWTTEVAIESTWRGDFYAILDGEQATGRVSLTFIENPMIRWMWCGGWIAGLGAVVGLWPARRRPPQQSAGCHDQPSVGARLGQPGTAGQPGSGTPKRPRRAA